MTDFIASSSGSTRDFAELLFAEDFLKSSTSSQYSSTVDDAIQLITQRKDTIFKSNKQCEKLFCKWQTKKDTISNKLVPGSSDTKITCLDSRYLLCRLCTIAARLMAATNDYSAAIGWLREASMWSARSAETCELLGSILRLLAQNQDQINEAEIWLRRSINAGKRLEEAVSASSAAALTAESLYDEQRRSIELRAANNATNRLLLLLLQTGRCHEADPVLSLLGYHHRLQEQLVNYPLAYAQHSRSSSSLIHTNKPAAVVIENFLPLDMLRRMQSVFAADSSFWQQHNYDRVLLSASRTAGYFSYVYPMRARDACCIEEQVIDFMVQVASALGLTAIQESSTQAEWWVHTRPHPAGHQLHYDSDEKHCAASGMARHPLYSAVLYLSDEDCGGPTLLSDQQLSHSRCQQLGSTAWLCPPRANRLLIFDARFLHGVLPGVGPGNGGRRLSFMVGFWPALHSSVLTGPMIGAAHCYPPQDIAAYADGLGVKEAELWIHEHAAIIQPNCSMEERRDVALDVLVPVQPLWTALNSEHINGKSDEEISASNNIVYCDHQELYAKLFQGF